MMMSAMMFRQHHRSPALIASYKGICLLLVVAANSFVNIWLIRSPYDPSSSLLAVQEVDDASMRGQQRPKRDQEEEQAPRPKQHHSEDPTTSTATTVSSNQEATTTATRRTSTLTTKEPPTNLNNGPRQAEEEKRTVVQFLDPDSLEMNDIFAASWWQTVSRFMDCDPMDIKIVEDDAFIPIKRAGRGKLDVRMSADYLDFTIEHLSKWWKNLMDERGKPPNPAAAQYAMNKLEQYITRHLKEEENNTNHDDRSMSKSIMNTTIGLIPLGVSDNVDEATQQIWTLALTATIISLEQYGIKRIVVVGYYQMDRIVTKNAFAKLTKNEKKWSSTETTTTAEEGEGRGAFETTATTADSGTMTELAFVYTDTERIQSKHIKHNIPKGAIIGLQMAFKINKNSMNNKRKTTTHDDIDDPTLYLGKHPADHFKYVYLTEADQILNARMSTQYLDEMDAGHIIVPHRLQPIVHRADTSQISQPLPKHLQYIPPMHNNSMEVYDLDVNNPNHSCFDTGWHGQKGGVCGNFWHLCGYKSGEFNHLDNTQFVRLTGGTNIVHVAATEHHRTCQPQYQTTTGATRRRDVALESS